ncbi:peptidase M48 Ste24p [Thermocrinis albus DSM 14484]|uniref:Protease HtpX homolog n=1 Tax=Thermocrinis albus (strain DSM 14484 / JCM 11386 / HI 11/12) TaxID=638303 RepID=D3SMM9_THEAH|nr:zinc metalloprotease HtpX [Thermocrinis albus]ADC90009.1 peptidase M48 Ste24p [Thermocrinis albus DSM 14484]
MGYMVRSVILLGLLTGIFLAVGHLIAGKTGMLIALLLAGVMNFIAYWFSDKIVLAMYGAREITPEEAPWLHRIVEDLAQRAGIPKPKVYLVPMEQPNAFATGRGPSSSAVAVTSGILQLLDEEELRGVLAHEIGHIKNRDVLVATMAATIAGAISYLVNMLQWSLLLGHSRENENNSGALGILPAILMIIVTPIIATIIQLAISRSREYLADETGAKICGCPLALARALEKIHNYVYSIPAEVNQGTAHLFIENPLSGQGIWELFSTHPSTEKRIERLHELARRMGVYS